MGMGLIIPSCSLRVACRTGTKQKVSRGVCRARAAGPVTRVDSKESVSSLRTKKQNFVGVSFLENQKADSPTMKFPTRWNRPLDTVFIREIKVWITSFMQIKGP
jgi:hypothetical protein